MDFAGRTVLGSSESLADVRATKVAISFTSGFHIIFKLFIGLMFKF